MTAPRARAFAGPRAARRLHLRQLARQAPETRAASQRDPLTLTVLASRWPTLPPSEHLTRGQVWVTSARLGGDQARLSDGPSGWRTLWLGWRLLRARGAGARRASRLGLIATP